MEESNKKGNQAFLDKFKGRTNKVDRKGLNQALDPVNLPSPPSNEKNIPNHRKKLASLETSNILPEYEMPKVDLDKLIPNDPESKNHFSLSSKRSTNTKITTQKAEYIPSLYDPEKTPAAFSVK